MTKQTTILILMLVLASPAGAQQTCNPAQGTGQCGFLDANGNVVSTAAEAYASYQRPYNNTYVEPAPVYRPPPPPPTHDCVAREGGKTCFDTRPGRIGSSYSTNAAGEFDDLMVESYPDGTPKMIATYRDGKKEGKSSFFYPDGAIETVMHYQNDELNGSVQHFHPNGTLRSDMTYCNGETCGEQHNYDEQGNIVKIIRWGANGDAEERRDYDEQGNIVKITRFDANGDVESVQEISPGNSATKKPRRKS